MRWFDRVCPIGDDYHVACFQIRFGVVDLLAVDVGGERLALARFKDLAVNGDEIAGFRRGVARLDDRGDILASAQLELLSVDDHRDGSALNEDDDSDYDAGKNGDADKGGLHGKRCAAVGLFEIPIVVGIAGVRARRMLLARRPRLALVSSGDA